MQFILRILFLFTISFIYADCEDFTNEADCVASNECEWHADDMACEESGHDDHDHECDDCMDYCVSYVMENYGYTLEEANTWCLTTSSNAFGCSEACEDHDHDDHEEGSNVIEIVGLAEGATTFTLSVMHDGHADYTSMPIYVSVEGGDHSDDDDHDDHEHCDELSETECVASDECEWHADDMACEEAGHDDHDDHEHCDELSETECVASDECEWHADDMACEEAGHDDHDHGDCGDFDHLDIDGLTLEHDGEVIYSQFQGYITGSLELHVDDRMDFTVHFLDQNGDEIAYTDENPASCFPLGFEINDPSIVSIEIEEHGDDHDDDHDDHDHDEECLFGDANMDGEVNVSDIVLMVGFIVGNNPLDSDHECADYIHDGNIDVLDIVGLVALILGERGEEATSAEFTRIDDLLSMNANGIVGAVQMTLSHSNNFEIELTSKALVADYHTNGKTTTLIVVNPVDDIFTTSNDYVIEEIIAATTEGYISTNWNGPASIDISNAYPNPFNPSTSFDINIGNTGFVSLSIYNISGQLVDVIYEGNMDAGVYNMTWNATDVSSGVYFLQAVGAGYVATQKLTLLK